MKHKNTTKRTLALSLLVMLMCVAMLVGTTFAWFTDSASTGVNKIEAGTLDVALKMKQGEDWVTAEGKTLQFKVNGQIPAEDTQILWEPGCTYELPAVKVVNNGSLALKYKVIISAASGDMALANVLDVMLNSQSTGNTLADALFTTDPDGFAHGKISANSDSGELKIALHMMESAGNEYQGKSIDGIAITVVATQDTVENDSFGNQYDVDAPYPVIATTTLINTAGETVVQDKDNNIKLTAPANSLGDDTTMLSLTVEETAAPSTITVGDMQAEQTFEVSLKDQTGTKVTAQGDTLFTVDMYVGPNRENLKLYHSGIAMINDGNSLTDVAEHYIYNSETGYVTMNVSSFSPFTVVYDLRFSVKTVADLAPIDNGSYYGNNTKGIYTLENDLDVTKVLRFGKDVVIDLNGHTLTTTASYWANYSNCAPKITIKNGTVVVGNYNFFWNVSHNEVVINLEKVTIDATKASAAFRTQPYQVSHKLTINADSDTVVKGKLLMAQPAYASADNYSVSDIVVNGVNVISSSNAVMLYSAYQYNTVNAEFNDCVFDCSKGNTPVYCSATADKNNTVDLTMNGCTLKVRSPYGISSYIFNYNQAGVNVTLNDCLDKDGNALTK